MALKPVFVYRGSSPQVVVGTSTLEKKNKDLNRATKELEAKMRNLQQRTESDKVGHTHTLMPSTWVLPPVFLGVFSGPAVQCGKIDLYKNNIRFCSFEE